MNSLGKRVSGGDRGCVWVFNPDTSSCAIGHFRGRHLRRGPRKGKRKGTKGKKRGVVSASDAKEVVVTED
eukprot:8996821-Prorocentrum_lima.AAC.1